MTYSEDGKEPSQRVQWISSREDIQRFIFESLAGMRMMEVSALEQEAEHNGGNLDIDSVEGVGIVGKLEGVLGRRVAGPEDLGPQQNSSLKNLTNLLHKSLQTSSQKGKKRTSREGQSKELI